MSSEDKFNAAVSVIRNLPKNGSYQPSHELMLRFYGFYKQATEGPARGSRPPFWDVVRRAKWDAWARLKKVSREDAMRAYVDELNKIVETMAFTDNVADFLTSLDNFSTSVPIEDLEMCIGPTLDKVRSQPGSPLSNSPLGSRDTSPTVSRIPSPLPVPVDQDEEDDDFFLDSIEQTEPESRTKKGSLTNGLSSAPETKLSNGYTDPRKHIESTVSEALQRAIESLRRDLTATNGRIQALEHHLAKRSRSWKGGLSREAILFMIVWPLVVHLVISWISRKRSTTQWRHS